jgi:hypothetical protein
MAEARQAVERPLSPHLSIYARQINMVMSILHRLTGAALYFGTLLLAAWLIAAAMGEAQFALVGAVRASDRQARPVRLHLGARPSHAQRHAASPLGYRRACRPAGQRSLVADDHRLHRPDAGDPAVGLLLDGGL